jgi:putative resolvase
MGRLLKVREAALILNVDRRTIWKWIKEGKIKAVRLPSGRYRIPESEVIRIITGAETLADLSENY